MAERPTPLKAQERHAQPEGREPSSRTRPAAPAGADGEFERELNGYKEEVLRLRDLLIARDAELGAARGRLAQVEQHAQRVARIADRIPIPGVARILAGLARLLRP